MKILTSLPIYVLGIYGMTLTYVTGEDIGLILALPGSTKGASESMDAIFPHVLHVFHILKGNNHDAK